MAEGPPVTDRLDSWKEIAAYVGRNVRTVIRWEQTRGFPVHRVPGGQRQAVYAWRDEIDAWLQQGDDETDASEGLVRPPVAGVVEAPPVQPVPQNAVESWSLRGIWAVSALAAVVILATTAFTVRAFTFQPGIEVSGLTPLTDDDSLKDGIVTDGVQAYFSAIQDGKMLLSSVPVSGGPIRLISTPFTSARPEAISPDGKDLLVLVWNGMEQERQLWIVPVNGGSPRRVGAFVCHAARWSPDGNRIAFAYGNSIYFTTPSGTAVEQVYTFASSVHELWWLSDGQTIRLALSSKGAGPFALWGMVLIGKDSSTVQSLFPLKTPMIPSSHGVAWDSKGALALVLRGDSHESSLWEMRRRWGLTGVDYSQAKLMDMPGPSSEIAIDPAHHQLLVTCRTSLSSDLERYDPTTRSFTHFLPGISAQDVDFSPDRQWIAYVDPSDQSLWISHQDGSARRQLVTPQEAMELPRWSPDGKQIAFMARTKEKAWRIYLIRPAGGPMEEASSGTDQQGAPTWSPDGKWLAYGTVDCEEAGNCVIRRINIDTAQELLIPGSEDLGTARWSPDGRFLAALRTAKQEVWLYDIAGHQWRRIAVGVSGNDLSWSPDSKYVFASVPTGDHPAILRIALKDNKAEPFVDLSSMVRVPGDISTWFTLTPDHAVLLLRYINTWEIYSMHYSGD